MTGTIKIKDLEKELEKIFNVHVEELGAKEVKNEMIKETAKKFDMPPADIRKIISTRYKGTKSEEVAKLNGQIDLLETFA